MELGGHGSPSSSCSASSFDSCSDLLSLLKDSSPQLGLGEGHHETLIDTLPGISYMMTDVKSQVDPGDLAFLQDGNSIKGVDQEVRSSQSRHCEDEGAIVGVEACSSENNEAESGPDMSQGMRQPMCAQKASSKSDDDRSSILKPGSRVSAGLEADSDLRHLENSIKFFDLYHKSIPLPHPLRSMSSRGSSPDLEPIDLAEIACNEQRYRQLFSSGIIKKDMMFASSPQKNVESASLLPWLNYEGSRKTNLTCIVETADPQLTAHKNRVTATHLNDSSESSDSTPDWQAATAAQAMIDIEKSVDSVLDEELLGKAQVRKIWPSSQVERESKELSSLDNNDLGPDEIGRYLESVDVNETYVNVCETSSSLLPHIHCVLSANEVPFTVNSVQVFGARQQRGGSSMWQRMVGVKNHTIYCIKVVSGKHEWEVQRRYRDFINFYRQLKRIFSGCGDATALPSFLQEVENDSRRVLGNTSPTVVEARVVRIEKFIQSLLQVGPPYSTATPIYWFLRPPEGAFEKTGFEEHLMVQGSALQKGVDVQLGTLNIPHVQSPPSSIGESSKKEQYENGVSFMIGKTIKLILTVHEKYSMKEVLHGQHHSCAGCYRHLEYEKGLIPGFAQAFGRGRPRFCEYTGQLFCSSCHLNELAVVPAYVLWHWDFTQKRVSQIAKAYLDSIYDQPLLCLSTANPYLYQRVPCLFNVQKTRAKLSRVLSCMRCDFHSRILNVMGSRRYLLENNDFFALRDLEDLSKGAFAVLPGLLTSVLKTLMLHVAKQCSICQDSGEWCGAGILCKDPFQPIFPFNEEMDFVNCKVCNAPFHKDCFAKCPSCPACPKNWVGRTL